MNAIPIAMFALGGIELLIIALILAFIGFWIWMLVDCALKEDSQNQKILWIVLMFMFGLIFAPLYFLIRKLPRKAKPI